MTDIQVIGSPGDTVVLLKPLTDAAKEWIQENVSKEGYQPYFPAVVVEHRYLEDILVGIVEAGLEVTR